MHARHGFLCLLLAASGCPAGSGLNPTERPPPEPFEDAQVPRSPDDAGPTPVHSLRPFSTRTLPGGVACLIRLREIGIAHRHLDRIEGVATPVAITGPIGEIHYRSLGRRALVCDCRLALALLRAGPILRNLGVEEMHFSSAYRNSLMPSGRPSRHALGLAIDVHRVTINGRVLDVERDFQRGLEDGCPGSNPDLNRLACLVKKWGLFDYVLTPDFDWDHRNHFHMDIHP